MSKFSTERLLEGAEGPVRNRYDELSSTQRRHVDAYINAVASGGDTPVAEQVKYWVDEARENLRQDKDVRHQLAMVVDAVVRPSLGDD
jgi:hypothetical protein